MSGDNEPLLPSRDKPILPVVNRRAPLLSRIRERRNSRGNLGGQVASKITELTLFSTDEERRQEATEIVEDFRTTLSAKLGVPEDAINPDLVEEFGAMFVALEEDDIVLEEVLEDDGEEDVEVEEESKEDSGLSLG